MTKNDNQQTEDVTMKLYIEKTSDSLTTTFNGDLAEAAAYYLQSVDIERITDLNTGWTAIRAPFAEGAAIGSPNHVAHAMGLYRLTPANGIGGRFANNAGEIVAFRSYTRKTPYAIHEAMSFIGWQSGVIPESAVSDRVRAMTEDADTVAYFRDTMTHRRLVAESINQDGSTRFRDYVTGERCDLSDDYIAEHLEAGQ